MMILATCLVASIISCLTTTVHALGDTYGYPALANLSFKPYPLAPPGGLGKCWMGWTDDGGSWLYLENGYSRGINSYQGSDRTCDGTFVYIDSYAGPDVDRLEIVPTNGGCGDCAGSYTQSQSGNNAQTYCYSKGHVLCNDGTTISFLGQNQLVPALWFLIFYSTSQVNEQTGFNQMSNALHRVSGGEYCGISMYQTMTKLQNDLVPPNNKFDWTCVSQQPETCEYDYGPSKFESHQYGTRPDLPAFALLRFATDNNNNDSSSSCVFHNSFFLHSNTLYEAKSWEPSHQCGQCKNDFGNIVESTVGLVDTSPNSLQAHMTVDLDDCTGTYTLNLAGGSNDYFEAPMHHLNLLCNNGEIFAMVAERDYSGKNRVLYYATKTQDEALNHKTLYTDAAQLFDYKDGPYCLAMNRLMTMMLRQTEDTTPGPKFLHLGCRSSGPPEPPQYQGICSGSALACHSSHSGSCMRYVYTSVSCPNKVAECEKEDRCGRQKGCRCLWGDVFSETNEGQLTCPGQPTLCADLTEWDECEQQSGCTWTGDHPPTTTQATVLATAPTTTTTGGTGSGTPSQATTVTEPTTSQAGTTAATTDAKEVSPTQPSQQQDESLKSDHDGDDNSLLVIIVAVAIGGVLAVFIVVVVSAVVRRPKQPRMPEAAPESHLRDVSV